MLLYHIVCPSKYRRKIFIDEVEKTLKEECIEISKRYEITFVEIGNDEDHVHYLVQGVPIQSPKAIVQRIKSITAREINIQISSRSKKDVMGGQIWTSGYYINTVGQYGNEKVIREYIENQGRQYKQIHRSQLNMFD